MAMAAHRYHGSRFALWVIFSVSSNRCSGIVLVRRASCFYVFPVRPCHVAAPDGRRVTARLQTFNLSSQFSSYNLRAAAQYAMQTDFSSVYDSIAERPCSRPTPEAL
jgi:hypothetical protein